MNAVVRAIEEHRGAAIAIVFALILRLMLSTVIHPWDWGEEEFKRYSFFDDRGYQHIAERLLEKKSISPWDFWGLRTPAYPLFLAAVYSVTGVSYWWAFLAQIALDCAVVAMTYAIAYWLSSRRPTATLAAMTYAISPAAILYDHAIRTEALFTFAFTAALCMFIKAEEGGWRLREAAAAGAALGLAALVRPVAIYFPPLLLATLPFSERFSMAGTRRRIASAALLVVSFLAVLAPWQLANFSAYGSYSTTSLFGSNVCLYNAAALKSIVEGISYRDAVRQLCTIPKGMSNPFEKATYRRDRAYAYILENPGEYAIRHAQGVYYLFTDDRGLPNRIWSVYSGGMTELGVNRQQFREAFTTPFTMLTSAESFFSALGAVVIFRQRRHRFKGIVIALTLLYFANITGVQAGYGFEHNSRFRLPMQPCLAVLSSIGLIESVGYFRARISWGRRIETGGADGERANC